MILKRVLNNKIYVPPFGNEPAPGDIDLKTGRCRCGCGYRSRVYGAKNKIEVVT